VRAFAYGFTAILLGHLLAQSRASTLEVGLVLSSIVLGAAFSSLLLMRFGTRIGRVRAYKWIYALLGLAGLAIALHPAPWTIALVGLTGVLSTDANDNGPATTLEQTMLAGEHHSSKFASIFGRYNGVAATFGSLGALTQGWLSQIPRFGTTYVGFYLLIPLGLLGWWLANSLDIPERETLARPHRGLKDSSVRGRIIQLSTLFAIDSAAGGLTSSAWLSYYLTTRYHASAALLGYIFFAFAILNALSMFLAPILAARIGLVMTMVTTHIASNCFFIIAAFGGSLKIAIIFLMLRSSLSQMDIPTRQALIMAVVPQEDRMAAAAVTNAARYSVRPTAPTISAALQHIALGAPLVVAGSVKLVYDLAILIWAKKGRYLTRTID
jgi:MFS family permease